MSALAQGGVMLVAGVIVLRTVLVEGHVNYVRPGLGIFLLLGAGAVILIAVASIWSNVAGKEGGHAPRVGWLVLVPMLALITIPQVPLGAFAAGLGGGRAPVRAAVDYPPLPEPREGAVDLSVGEFVGRALHDPGSVEGEIVRLVGFVAPNSTAPSGWLLTRFAIGCCAADAVPIQVAVANDVPRAADEWVEVLGVLVPGSPGSSPPVLSVVEARPVPQPDNPYEY